MEEQDSNTQPMREEYFKTHLVPGLLIDMAQTLLRMGRFMNI
jgi:hypothetical protein